MVHQSVVRHVLTGMAIAAAGFGFVGLRPDLMVIEHVEFAGLERSGQFDLRHLSELRKWYDGLVGRYRTGRASGRAPPLGQARRGSASVAWDLVQ